jgi:hypothetical protein
VYFQHTLACSRPSFVERIASVTHFTLVAVGAGVAAMVQTLHHLLPLVMRDDLGATGKTDTIPSARINLVYGNRHVKDILLRELLEGWAQQYHACFNLVYVIGSRYDNVHQHSADCPKKCKVVHPPPEPEGFEQLPDTASIRKEKGWVSEAILAKHAFAPAANSRVRVVSVVSRCALDYHHHPSPLCFGFAMCLSDVWFGKALRISSLAPASPASHDSSRL